MFTIEADPMTVLTEISREEAFIYDTLGLGKGVSGGVWLVGF